MNLLDQAKADNAYILEDDVAGFGRAFTYTAPAGSPLSLKGQYIRRGTAIDPNTGLPVSADVSAISFSLASFQVLAGAGVLPVKGATIVTTDSTGATVTGRIPEDGLMLDRVLDRATCLLKVTT